MNEQLVVAEYKNGEFCLYRVVSNSPITINIVAEWFEQNLDMDFEKESITFLMEPEIIEL